MADYLPPELLEVIEEEVGASLSDLWQDRYLPVTRDEAEPAIDDGSCAICGRFVSRTRHHLIPRELHRSLSKDSRYTKEILGRTISICRMCHSTIHRFFTHSELANSFNTLELLLSNEKMLKYAKWASALPSRGNLKVR